MPKSRTVAARRRAKRHKRAISLAGGNTAQPRPEYRGRPPVETPEDAMRTVKHARIRNGATEAMALAPIAGEPIGLCLLELAPDEAPQLWQVWCALDAARSTYRARTHGKTADPQNATLPMLSEPMQTDQSPRVDLREPDEKDRDAIAAWQRWEARIDRLEPPMLRWALRDPLDGTAGALWLDGRPTHRGRNAVTALRRLAEGKVR
jgi:hypothetical protein